MKHPETQRFWQGEPGGGGGMSYPPEATGVYTGHMPAPAAPQTDEERLQETYLTGGPQEMAWALKELQNRRTYKSSGTPPDTGTYQPNVTFAPKPQGPEVTAVVRGAESKDRIKLRIPEPGAQQAGAGGGPAAATGDMPPPGGPWLPGGGTRAKYSKAQVARARARGEEMKGYFPERDKLVTDLVNQTYGWIAEARKEQEAAGFEASSARAKYEAAAQSLQRTRKALETFKVDPDRYWNSMPSSQQMLMRIGLFFGGLAEGLSGGRLKSAAMQMLMAAQQRDMQAQRTNYQKLVQQAGLDEKQQQIALDRYDKSEAQRRLTGLEVMKLQLSRAGLMERRLGHKEKYAELIYGIDQQMLAMAHASKGTRGKPQLNPLFKMWYGNRLKEQSTEKALKLKAEMKAATGSIDKTRGAEAMMEARELIPILRRRFYNMPKSALLGSLDWTGEVQDYERIRMRLSVALWRMYDSGKLSDKDMDVAMKSFLPPGKVGAIPKYREAYGKAFNSLNDMLDRAEKRMKAGVSFPQKRKEKIRSAWIGLGLGTGSSGDEE